MKKWIPAIAISSLVNFLAFTGMAFVLALSQVNMETQPEAIVLDFVEDGGASSGTPQVAAPKPEKITMPTPLTAEQLQEIKDGLPVDQVVNLSAKTQATFNSANTAGAEVGDQKKIVGDSTTINGDGDDSTTVNGDGDDRENQGDESRGITREARALNVFPPALPSSLEGSGWTGRVVVGYRVGPDGSVVSAWVEQSSGNADADAASVDVAYQWSFEPALEDGQAVEYTGSQGIRIEE